VGRFSASFAALAGTNTANTQLFNLVGGGITERLTLREIYMVNTAAITTAPLLTFGRSTARGTQTASATVIRYDPDDPPTCALDTAWSVAPTFTNTAANRFRLDQITTAVGQQTTWVIHAVGIWTPATAGAGICVWNVNASGNPNNGSWFGHVIWDED
jgi:hypothetical protein